MRAIRLATVIVAVLICGATVQVRAQDLYESRVTWKDDRAEPFVLDALRGRPALLTMAYGTCRRICSTSLRIMESLQTLADQRGLSLNFVVVGLDPSQDKPSDWAAFRFERKLKRPNWYFLSGDESMTRRLASRLGINYWRYDEHVMHDFKIVLLSPEGAVLRTMDRFDQPLPFMLP